MTRITLLVTTLTLALSAGVARANDADIERNVVYGMVSGAAMLMDVYPPTGDSRARGVLFFPGSGWFADESFDALPLKDMAGGWEPGNELARAIVNGLRSGGYTVFVGNHRAAPRFRYPAALDDAARAAAFIRANAERFGIDATTLGGAGTSSGGSLVSLLGSQDDLTDNSRLQAVMTVGSPMDLIAMFNTPNFNPAAAVTWIGHGIAFMPDDHPHVQTWRKAGTAFHASKGDAPHLIVHGSADELVPLAQGEAMHERWGEVGVPSKLWVVPDGMHSEHLLGAKDGWLQATVDWFDQHL